MQWRNYAKPTSYEHSNIDTGTLIIIKIEEFEVQQNLKTHLFINHTKRLYNFTQHMALYLIQKVMHECMSIRDDNSYYWYVAM